MPLDELQVGTCSLAACLPWFCHWWLRVIISQPCRENKALFLQVWQAVIIDGTAIKVENKPTWANTSGEGVLCSVDPVSFPFSKLEEMPTSLGSYRSVLPQNSKPGTHATLYCTPSSSSLTFTCLPDWKSLPRLAITLPTTKRREREGWKTQKSLWWYKTDPAAMGLDWSNACTARRWCWEWVGLPALICGIYGDWEDITFTGWCKTPYALGNQGNRNWSPCAVHIQTLHRLQQIQGRQKGRPLGFFRWELLAVPGGRG